MNGEINSATVVLTPEEQKTKVEEHIIDCLLNDFKTVPKNVLRYKVIQKIREEKLKLFLDDILFDDAITNLEAKGIVAKSPNNRFYIDYMDWPLLSEERKTGILKINEEKKSGIICACETLLSKHKASHYVHSSNLLGAKHNDFVEFVELDTSSKKSQSVLKRKYIDAKVVQVLNKNTYLKLAHERLLNKNKDFDDDSQGLSHEEINQVENETVVSKN